QPNRSEPFRERRSLIELRVDGKCALLIDIAPAPIHRDRRKAVPERARARVGRIDGIPAVLVDEAELARKGDHCESIRRKRIGDIELRRDCEDAFPIDVSPLAPGPRGSEAVDEFARLLELGLNRDPAAPIDVTVAAAGHYRMEAVSRCPACKKD